MTSARGWYDIRLRDVEMDDLPIFFEHQCDPDALHEAINALQKSLEDDETSFTILQNVIEQSCNFFLRQDRFPTSYEEMQPIPLLKVGMLTYAGDDGKEKG